MTDREDPGTEHDAHLRAALRHAPDAALGPSAAVDSAILRRARSATAEATRNVTPQGAFAADGAAVSPGTFAPHDAAASHRPFAPRDATAPPRPPREDPRPKPVRTTMPTGSRIAGWWSWLARPSVATGFAGVMVATLVGVMWWGRPLDEALPPRYETRPPPAPAPTAEDGSTAAERRGNDVRAAGSSPATANGVTSPDASPSGAPVPVSPPPNSRPPDSARRDKADAAAKPASPTPAAPTAPAALAKRQAEPSAFPAPEGAAADPRKLELSIDEASRSRAEADATRARLADTAREPAASSSPSMAQPGVPTQPSSMPRFEVKVPQANAPAPPRPPAATQADGAPSARDTPSGAARSDSTIAQELRASPERLALQERPPMAAAQPPVAASAQREAQNREIAGAVDGRMAQGSETGRRSTGGLAANRAEPPTRSTLAPLRTALVTEAGRWTWSGDGGRVQRVTPELLAWLARLDIAIAAQPADSSSAASLPDLEADAVPSTTPSGPVRTVVLLREGRRHTELRLGDVLEVTPIDPPGPRWRVTLAPETAAALRESLP